MSFLLAKILLLLIFAAVLGAWFARWWLRRHYEDVTSEYTRMEDEWFTWRRAFEERLAQRPVAAASDMTPLLARFDRVEASIRSIEIPQPVATDLHPVMTAIAALPTSVPAVDLQPTHARMTALEQVVRGIQIPTPKDVDMGPLLSRLEGLENKVAAIRIPEPAAPIDLGPTQRQLAEVGQAVRAIQIPAPKEVDMGPVLARLGSLETKLAAIRIPEPAAPVDLGPTQRQLAEVGQAVAAIKIPVPKDVDFGAVNTRLQALDQAVRSIRIPEIPAPQTIDLSTMQARLDALAEAVRNLRMPHEVDLAPTQQRLEALERAVRDIVIPPITQVDLQPVLQKLAELESRPAAAPPPAPAPVSAPDAPAVRAGSRNLLSHAGYGKADDLKQMKGVKKVMEKMLHEIGVYYFWQIADWTLTDMRHADAQLTAFHGRIERDDWVGQASGLSRAPDAASKPADM